MKTLKLMVVGIAVILCFVAVPLTAKGDQEDAAAEKEYMLKFNHVLNQNDPFHKAFLKWSEAVSERTGGKMKVEVFHSAQLGVEEDIIEQIRMGANVGQNTDSARMGNYIPGVAVMNGPYFADSLEEVQKLTQAPTIVKWLKELEDTYGIKVLSFNWVQGFRNFLTNKEIHSPDDLKGLRIRAPGAPIWMESVRSLGPTPVALPFSELYSGIQTKTVDGAGNVNVNTYNGKLYEVADYLIETKHILLINFEIVSAKWFNSLPVEYQKILQEECDKAGRDVSKEVEQFSEEAKDKLQAEGMIVIPYADIDIPAFKKAGIAAYEKLGILDAYKQVQKEIGK